jgi:hypothetical protein
MIPIRTILIFMGILYKKSPVISTPAARAAILILRIARLRLRLRLRKIPGISRIFM